MAEKRQGSMTVEEAGRRGGEKVSQDREHMCAIGRKGGEHSHGGSRSASHRGSKE